jgi:high-affinity iron transporter
LDVGALMSGLVTGLREGVEVALIMAIVLAYLVRTGNGREAGKVWLGAGSAGLVSLLAGIVIFTTVGEFGTPYEQIFEGTTLLVACGVVTWMLFWMRRQSRAIKGELEGRLARTIGEGAGLGLAVLAFSSVIREGLETAIFLVGQATSAAKGAEDGAASVLVGALVGLAIAAVLGLGMYRGSRRIDLRRFFSWTGITLVFIAAGLLASASHEFIEIGAIGFGTQTLYDLSALLPDDAGVGQFLHAIMGYSATPALTTMVLYLGYLAVVLTSYLRPSRPVGAPSRGGAVAGAPTAPPAEAPREASAS